jgi:hypothetical protein
LTFETADSSGSAAVARVDVKVVSGVSHLGGLIERKRAAFEQAG